MPPGFISITEAGARVGLGKSASYRAARNGDIPFVTLNAMWLVKEDWFDKRWEEAEEVAAAKRAAAAEHQQQQIEAKRAEAIGEVSPALGGRHRHQGMSAAADVRSCGLAAEGGSGDGKPADRDP